MRSSWSSSCARRAHRHALVVVHSSSSSSRTRRARRRALVILVVAHSSCSSSRARHPRRRALVILIVARSSSSSSRARVVRSSCSSSRSHRRVAVASSHHRGRGRRIVSCFVCGEVSDEVAGWGISCTYLTDTLPGPRSPRGCVVVSWSCRGVVASQLHRRVAVASSRRVVTSCGGVSDEMAG
jgi:hypothetical protein